MYLSQKKDSTSNGKSIEPKAQQQLIGQYLQTEKEKWCPGNSDSLVCFRKERIVESKM